MKMPGTIALVCAGVLGWNATSSADGINPGEKPVTRCASIDNVNDFPDIVVIGASVYSGPITRYVVKQDSCLTKGYKFATFYLVWTPKAYFDSVGLDSLPIAQIAGTAKRAASSTPPVYLLSSAVEPYGGTVPATDPLAAEELHYLLMNNNGSVTVYLAQKVSIMTDGTRTVENYSSSAKQQRLARRGGNLLQSTLRARGYFAFSTDFTCYVKASIIDCAGRTLRADRFECRVGATYVFSFGNLRPGIYWVRLQTPNGVFAGTLRNFG